MIDYKEFQLILITIKALLINVADSDLRPSRETLDKLNAAFLS
jgi:hypothetical protein